MTVVVQIVGLLHLPLVIAALVFLLQNYKRGDKRLAIARNVAIAMIGFDAMIVLLRPQMLQFPDIAFMAMLDVVVVLKLWVMIYVGWILWERRSGDYWGIRFWTSQRRAIVLTGTVVVAGMIAYSVLLFYLFSPRLGEAVRILGGGDDIHGFEEWLLVSVVVTNFAISEEFIYRGCIQAMLTRWFGDRQAGAWAAIILTAVLWTLMHTGSLEPNWIKYAQVFPLAIFLGWWFSRAGFLGTVSIHVLFNLLMVPLAQQIIHS